MSLDKEFFGLVGPTLSALSHVPFTHVNFGQWRPLLQGILDCYPLSEILIGVDTSY